ncbi:basic amino acid ABC transporter substrate-binding protein [Tepidibacillus sp. HK-1]|uniref:basic amino acid ABC transporter substrate-binding protein n=1 Tax=Tepidibacillus sp. HK-1 TaxID=1883407 RepID=UPI000858ABCD|nr:basic amino acid ABC transporter substrate-binding protein [Tepidibacillus sp. HK-1]GBF10558.1 putative ABC transporter arginine-binding protein 2 precursor [Tepidibacillus sp. HK-1]
MKRNFKIGILSLILIIGSIGLIGCGASQENKTENQAKEGTKTYTVVTDATFPPFESTLPSGEVVGFDMDLVNAIAEVQGFKVNIQHVGWDPMMNSISTGKADIGAAGISIDDERKQSYDFTEPYFEATQYILVPEDSTVTSVDDLKGQNIGFQSGTTGEKAVQKVFGKDYAGAKGYVDLPTAVNDMLTGRIVAVVGDNAVLGEFLKQFPDKNLKVVKDDRFEKEFYGLMVKKGNQELLDQLNAGLKKIKENGKYQEIYNKYFAE